MHKLWKPCIELLEDKASFELDLDRDDSSADYSSKLTCWEILTNVSCDHLRHCTLQKKVTLRKLGRVQMSLFSTSRFWIRREKDKNSSPFMARLELRPFLEVFSMCAGHEFWHLTMRHIMLV